MTGGLNLDVARQGRRIRELGRSRDDLIEDQELLKVMLKELADCFQLDYVEGRYVSKRNLKNYSKRK